MNSQESNHHVDDLRLPYLEGLLSPEDQSNFENHVRNCPDCESKLRETSKWASILTNDRQAMCLEEWELFDYVRTGDDPSGIISKHLDACSSCRVTAESFKTVTRKQGMPANLWDKMKDLSRQPLPDRRTEPKPNRLIDLLNNLLDLFRPVVLVPAAVAAAVLIMVLVYPTRPMPTMAALSSVTWGPGASTFTLMGPRPREVLPTGAEKGRLAIVITLTNFKHPPDQKHIDGFYRALEPPVAIRDRYNVVSPAELKNSVGEGLAGRATDDKSIVAEIGPTLGLSQVLIIEIQRDRERYGIRARLMEVSTGSIAREWDSRNLTDTELASALEKAALATLNHEK